MCRARAGPRQSCPQPVCRARQLSGPLRLHRAGAGMRFRCVPGAGDYLKEKHGARTVAVEASECPTLLRNGFGEHNIQGIGDKHVPYIHNVMNTDIVAGVSDRSTGALDLLFNSRTGLDYLSSRRRVDAETIAGLKYLGLSGIANLVGAIKTAKRLELGDEDVLVTVATDSAALYGSERRKFLTTSYPDGFDAVNAGEVF